MPLQIHIDPQFEGLRQEMRRYPSQVVDKATVRTLNRLATRARSQATKGIASHYRIPQKNIRKRIQIQKATRHQHRAIVGFITGGRYGRSIKENMGQEVLASVGNLLKHLDGPDLKNRLDNDVKFRDHRSSTSRPFVQAPKGYLMAFVRLTRARYPIDRARVNLTPVWASLQDTLRANAAQAFPREWRRNADFYKRRMNARHIR
jgi:hypothetical protein